MGKVGKGPTAKPVCLSSTLRTHKVEENYFLKVSSGHTLTAAFEYCGVRVRTYTHTQIKIGILKQTARTTTKTNACLQSSKLTAMNGKG